MATVRNHRRPALIVTALAAIGLGAMSTTTPAFADNPNTIDVNRIGPENLEIVYNCQATAGVVGIKAMVGAPQADAPSAQGAQNAVTCDGTQQTTVVVLTGTPLSRGQEVLVNAALVDATDTVVAGQKKKATLG
ncbi:hypothetical protein [Nocardia wallacei]|uniref:hypothetical protein n=1 Tax=Nocardia wallacei TaxID=480035 RepID=UPI00245870A8|nr:hypothetical protein [Nocardia wallacei]